MDDVTIKPVPDFPGYFAGSDGSVWSESPRRLLTARRRLRPGEDSTGRQLVVLCRGGKKHTLRVHRIILETFVGPRPDGMECLHADGNPRNNRIDNLRWGTSLENKADQLRHGTRVRGSKVGSARLNREQVEEIRALYAAGGSTQAALASQFGVQRKHVSDIVRGKRWCYVEIPENQRQSIQAVAAENELQNRISNLWWNV